MSLNPTLNYLLAKKTNSMLLFGRQLTNTTVSLYGPGQIDTIGVPIPCTAKLRRLFIYDGVGVQSIGMDVPVYAGELISVEAAFNATVFTITVKKNQVATALSVTGIGGYHSVFAVILIELLDPEIG